MSHGFDEQTEAWLAEQFKKLPHDELGKLATEVQDLGAGMICPNPACSLTDGRIACAPVALAGSPIRYIFVCGECFIATSPSATPEAARDEFLKSCRTIPWNDNKGRTPN